MSRTTAPDTQLSPAAQAVLDAIEDDCIHPVERHRLVRRYLEALDE